MDIQARTVPRPPPRLLFWGILGGMLLVLYRDILPAWGLDLWNDSNYSHGLLIPFVSLYFVWQRWDTIKTTPPQPAASGFLIITAGILLHIIGVIGSEFFLKRLSLIVLLYGMVLALEGRQTARLLRFPIAILFFAIPLPYILYNAVAFPLKLVATRLAVAMLHTIGMPVFAEGNVIHLAHTTLEVVDACSGIRSLMTLITLAFFLAYFFTPGFWRRSVLVVLALPITIAANSLRVAITGLMTRYDPAWGAGFWHEFTGWLVFVLSFALLMGIAMLLRPRHEEDR